MKLVVTKVQRGIYRLERFKVNCHLLFFPIFSNDGSSIKYQPVRRNLVIKLESLLSRSNGTQYRLAIHPAFDVGSSSKFIAKHLSDPRNLIAWRHNKRYHAGTITFC
ncbi:hypothetical protein PanWU01x14_335710 [Parasponia andersonii]|uniref:Uncharacterized protein n=1 Tax=Parasponia andersonii TaxID=3476 RepID=A0A2P5AG18_PARAD|nr:hypothetical protein PanWU01x14_335710 [Parasponia andersonii]